MPFGYPVMLEVQGRRCLVIGGGSIGEGKVLGLLDAKASVAVIAPEFTTSLEDLGSSGDIELIRRRYQPGDLDGAFLAITATDDPALNARIFQDAEAARVLFNSVDDIEHCHFAAPSIVRRGDLVLAVSTGGKAPALAKRLRKQLAAELPEEYGAFLIFLGEVREKALAVRTVPFEEWARRWDVALGQDLFELVRSGRLQEARASLWKALNDPDSSASRGRVAIVGAGPGDPGLLTLNAKQELAEAEIVVYDRLVNPELVSGKESIYVGKLPGSHSLPQREINELLVRLAGEGKRVVRLKGGDPFVFGRGGEEAEALAAAGIDFTVVPAPTSAIAALAAAGIPVTDRRYGSSVTIVTGHCGGGKPVNWEAMASTADTIVVLMGIKNLSTIAGGLLSGGLPAGTPAAVVENGTLPNQRVVVTELCLLEEVVRREGIQSPSVIVVGEVVRLRERLLGAAEQASR